MRDGLFCFAEGQKPVSRMWSSLVGRCLSLEQEEEREARNWWSIQNCCKLDGEERKKERRRGRSRGEGERQNRKREERFFFPNEVWVRLSREVGVSRVCVLGWLKDRREGVKSYQSKKYREISWHPRCPYEATIMNLKLNKPCLGDFCLQIFSALAIDWSTRF